MESSRNMAGRLVGTVVDTTGTAGVPASILNYRMYIAGRDGGGFCRKVVGLRKVYQGMGTYLSWGM